MNKKPKQKPNSGIQINNSRTPRKKNLQSDPFARIQLHPLEELESREESQNIIELNKWEPTKTDPDPTLPDPTQPNITIVDPTQQDYILLDPTQPNNTLDYITLPDPTIPYITLPDTTLSPQINVETSPVKNFTKVPNSIAKKAIPEKLFKGLSKHTYDVLYQLTRGAIHPVRKIQLSKRELVKLTGLASNTIQTHVRYLKESGLLKVELVSGKHDGSIYEVFVPEEIGNSIQVYPTPPNPTPVETIQESRPDTIQNSDNVGLGYSSENKEFNSDSKTLKDFKEEEIKETDDETFAGFIDKLQKAAIELTGKKLSKRENGNLEKLADLLILELKVAAQRTGNISSIPAFLTEVLRRQFFAARNKQNGSLKKESKIKVDTVGKADSGSYEIKSLDEKGREAALEQLREWAGDDLLQDFEKWYTPEDWIWLMKKLEINQS